MIATRSKKVLLLCILEILKRYSDENHKLTQTKIIKLVKQHYDLDIERKAVARNIQCLIDFGYDISNYEDGSKGYCLLSRDFSEGELRLLVDSVLSSRYIPENYARDLVEKLIKQASVYFKNRTRHIYRVGDWPRSNNKDIFLNIDLIDEAIEKKKKISFVYNEYGLDKKLHPRREERFLVNPYQMILHNQRYYLILNVDKYDDISCYRIDHITDIKITKIPIRPLRSLKDYENGLDLGKMSSQHPYLFCSSKTERIVLRSRKNLIGDFLDWFGSSIEIKELEDDHIEVTVQSSAEAMRYWALQYGTCVEVISPLSLRQMICNDLKVMWEKYNEPSSC